MKILQVYKTYLSESLGGVEQMMAQLAQGTKSLGMEHRILCLSSKPQPAVLHLPEADVFRYRQLFEIASTGFSLTAISGMRQLAKWADIIHYHYPWPFGDMLYFLSGIKRPTVLTYHSDIVRQQGLLNLYRPLQHAFLQKMDSIVATSENYLHSSETLQKFASKTCVIPLGLNKEKYPQPTTEQLQPWQARLGEKFFLFIGVLRYYKGLSTLLDAAKHLPFPIVIAGSGPMQAELEQRIGQEKLSHVTLLGKISEIDKIALLQSCTAFVFPSHLRSEAFGLSLLEAAMCGKPLISCEIGTGTSYINLHEKTGFVIPPADPMALGKAMKILWENPTLAKQFGTNAYQRYQALFTAEKMCAAYTELYLASISNNLPQPRHITN